MKHLQTSERSRSLARLTSVVSSRKSTGSTQWLILIARYYNNNNIVNMISMQKQMSQPASLFSHPFCVTYNYIYIYIYINKYAFKTSFFTYAYTYKRILHIYVWVCVSLCVSVGVCVCVCVCVYYSHIKGGERSFYAVNATLIKLILYLCSSYHHTHKKKCHNPEAKYLKPFISNEKVERQ